MRLQSNVTCTLIVLILVSAACGSEAPISPSATLPVAQTPTRAPTFTSTPVSTFTPEAPASLSTDIPNASPTPFGGSGRILFVSCDYETVTVDGATFDRPDNDSCEIYSMNADGSDRVNLTNNEVWDADPAPSPDGTKIAYVTDLGNDNSEIYLMNADGSGKIQLTHNRDWDTGPAWSPDGSQLVFSVLQDSEISEIRTIKADGSDQKVLASFSVSSEGYLLSPAWSPLGTYIAYVREGFQGMECQGCSAIFVMNSDGSNPTQVSHNPTSHDPAWSPDGTKILYTAGSGIFAIALDGSGETKIAGTEGHDSNPS